MRGDKFPGTYGPTTPKGKFQEGEIVTFWSGSSVTKGKSGPVVGYKRHSGGNAYFVLITDPKGKPKIVGSPGAYLKRTGKFADPVYWEEYAYVSDKTFEQKQLFTVRNPEMLELIKELANTYGFEYIPLDKERALELPGVHRILMADKLLASIVQFDSSTSIIGLAQVKHTKRGHTKSVSVIYELRTLLRNDITYAPTKSAPKYRTYNSCSDVESAKLAIDDPTSAYGEYRRIRDMIDESDVDILNV